MTCCWLLPVLTEQFVFGRTEPLFMTFSYFLNYTPAFSKGFRCRSWTGRTETPFLIVERSAQVCPLWSFQETMPTGLTRLGWLAWWQTAADLHFEIVTNDCFLRLIFDFQLSMLLVIAAYKRLDIPQWFHADRVGSFCGMWQVWSLAWSPDGSRLATGGSESETARYIRIYIYIHWYI